jgi:hypothetical protein
MAWVWHCATCILACDSLIVVGVECGDGQRQWRRSSKFCADGLELVKDECGGLHQGTEVRGWTVDGYHLATLTSKCTWGDGIDGVNQVRIAVDQVKQRREDLVIRQSRTSGDTCWDCWGNVADTRLQQGLVVSSSKSWGGSRGGLWHHWRACIKAKRLYEEIMVVQCSELNLYDYALGFKWFNQNI